MSVETATAVSSNLYDQRRELSVLDATAKEMEKLLPDLPDEQKAIAEEQIKEIKATVDEGLDIKQAVVVGAITAPLSLVIETAPLLAASKASTKLLKSDDFTLKEILDARRKQLNIASAPTSLTGDKAADNVAVTTTNIYDGGDLLDEQGAPTAIAQMQVKNSIDKQADLIAASIWQQMPEMAPKVDEKTFDAVQRTLDNFDRLDRNVIDRALADAGTDLPNFMAKLEAAGLDGDSLQKFSAMYGVSASDAARTLQSKSVISRMLNKMREVDPEAAKAVDALMGKPDPASGAISTTMAFIRQADRNMITAMTTNAATVMRNAFGIGLNATYGAAEDAIESLIFNMGRKLGGHMKGSPVTGDIKNGLYQAFDDAIDTFESSKLDCLWFADQNILKKKNE
jgi:antitoxin component HigA of HigAB toxin-antitoxin module